MEDDDEDELPPVVLEVGDLRVTSAAWLDLLAEQEEDEDLLTPQQFADNAVDKDVYAMYDRVTLRQPLDRRSLVMRFGEYVFVFDSSGHLRDEPELGRVNGREKLEDFLREWREGYYGMGGAAEPDEKESTEIARAGVSAVCVRALTYLVAY